MSSTQQWNPDLSPTTAWMAKTGDRLGGTITEISSRSSAYSNQPYPIVTIRAEIPGCTEEGGKPIPLGAERAFHAFRTVARNRLAELRPRVGEQLGIAHFGPADASDAKSPFRYRITMNRAAGDVDWASMTGPDQGSEQIQTHPGQLFDPDENPLGPDDPDEIPY